MKIYCPTCGEEIELFAFVKEIKIEDVSSELVVKFEDTIIGHTHKKEEA
jgi:hypothetical protein